VNACLTLLTRDGYIGKHETMRSTATNIEYVSRLIAESYGLWKSQAPLVVTVAPTTTTNPTAETAISPSDDKASVVGHERI